MMTNWGCMVDWSWSRYYVSPGIRALSEPCAVAHCHYGYTTTNRFQKFSSNVDAKLMEDQDVMVFIHSSAKRAVVLVYHVLTIKESYKHDLTSAFLVPHFLWLQLAFLQPDEWFLFQKGTIVMDPQLISGNDSYQKLWLFGDHYEVFGASVETSLVLSICRKCGTHAKHTRFFPNLSLEFDEWIPDGFSIL